MSLIHTRIISTYLLFFAFLVKGLTQIPTSYNVYQSSEDEFVRKICYTPNGDMFVAGSLLEATSIFLKKIQEPGLGGGVIWNKKYNNINVVENLRDLKVAPDGNLLLLIEQRTDWGVLGLNSANCHLLKVNTTNGEIIWEAHFDGGRQDVPIDLEVLPDGSCLILGSSNSHVGSNAYDEFLWLPVAADGTLGTPKYLAVNAFAYASVTDAALAPDGSLYAISAVQVVKFDAEGHVLWEKPFGQNITDRFMEALYLKQDGSLLIGGGGALLSSPEALDAILIHLTAEGEFIWQKTYGGDGIEIIEALLVCEEEDKIVCVGQDTPNDFVLIDGFYFLVTDMAGNEIASTTVGGNTPSLELGLAITHTRDGRVVAAGTTEESGTGDVMLLYTEGNFFACSPPGMVNATTEIRLAPISISPNPNAGDFTVLQEGAPLPFPSQFVLFDAFGKLVWSQFLDHADNQVSGLNLPDGLYFYQLSHEGQVIGKGKLVMSGH